MNNNKSATMEMTGYEPLTCFWALFSAVDILGEKMIKYAYSEAVTYAKTNYKFLTELVMVLNHKIWQHYKTNETIARLYNNLWMKLHDECLNTLKDKELEYYLRILD